MTHIFQKKHFQKPMFSGFLDFRGQFVFGYYAKQPTKNNFFYHHRVDQIFVKKMKFFDPSLQKRAVFEKVQIFHDVKFVI